VITARGPNDLHDFAGATFTQVVRIKVLTLTARPARFG
jgi:hypothetical protein